jgi:DNA mismatch repair protein MutS
LNLSDLNVESELIPFFDISLNRHSHEALASLFHTMPKTCSAALERQQVLAGFTANLDRIKNLQSYKADIEEAYEFCCRLESDVPEANNTLRSFRMQLLFSRNKKLWLLSRSIQLLVLFEKIYRHYLSGLDISEFPSWYQDSIRHLVDTVSAFEKERSSLIEKGNDLSAREVTGFIHKLYAVSKSGKLSTCWNDLFLFEAFLSIAVTAQRAGFFPARFIDKGIRLTGFFHPLIKNPVKNSIQIDKNVFVLTGPNMSGKSTLLRSISLCVYLARLGLPVPADECHVIFAGEVNVFINSRDNPNSGYSHFMTEILHLKDSIVAAQEEKQVFAVFDELFSGTNIDDALNILTITISGLKKFTNSYFLLSTHFYKLKELQMDEMSHAAFHYVDSFLENGVPKFTYQVKEGWSDIKFGSILFEREGLLEILKD